MLSEKSYLVLDPLDIQLTFPSTDENPGTFELSSKEASEADLVNVSFAVVSLNSRLTSAVPEDGDTL